MPTIKFNAGFDATAKRILNETFKIVTHKLELTRDFRVHASLEYFESPQLYNRVRRVPDGGLYEMEFNSNQFNLFDATCSFGHELIHVQQHEMGWLNDREGKTLIEAGAEWKGEFYPAMFTQFMGNSVPWERDAWERMGELHKYVVANLPAKDRELINPAQSHGLNKTWDENYHPWRD